METEDPEAWGGQPVVPHEDSGSAYEESDEEVPSSSQEEEPEASRSLRANPITRRSRGRSRSTITQNLSRDASVSVSDGERSLDSSTASQREERQRAAEEWAATFQAPESPTDIRSPARHAAGTQSKRKAVKPPSEVRAKRLKSWYNNEYRELLNLDIHDVAARSIAEGKGQLEESQIGCSIWTTNEKDLFFSALSRLGRDNIQQIASRIGSKSEIGVQEYIHLLHHETMEKPNKLLGLTDLPAAIEISDECCGLLERAGDALASRQERAEEEIEQEKWGDLWLLDSKASKRLERRRKDEAGRRELEGTLPAANLFHLRNWLELSRRVFMNPDTEDDNWETIAEPGETPAIRSTAFEDFHSLAVSITKRLISTTLFCTMSRQRATGAKTIKHAEVNQNDVEAAVKILSLKLNSQDLWRKCARRCNIKIFDEEWNSFMSYEEVEKTLSEIRRERSRSRSVSRHERSVSRAQSEVDQEYPTDSPSISEDYGSDDSLRRSQSDLTNSVNDSDDGLTDYLTEGKTTSSKSREERLLQKARVKKDAERAHEKYVEAFDQEASRREEQRLWTLLRQTAPFDIKTELGDLPEQPKGIFRDDVTETGNWRGHVQFRSQWETMDTPVLEEKFNRNRKRISRRAKRRMERARFGGDVSTRENSEDEESEASADGSNEDEDEEYENAQEHLVEGDYGREDGDQKALEEAATDLEDENDEVHHAVQGDFAYQLPHQEENDEANSPQQVDYEEDIDIHEPGPAESQSPTPQSPMSVDVLSRQFHDPENARDSDLDTPIKPEYESDS